MKEIKVSMKRGISPLISYILIVTLSVSIGFLVINALTNEISKIEIDSGIEYCEDVSISVDGFCVNSDNIIIVNVTSTGAFSVHKFSFGRITDVAALQWCDATFEPPLDFGIETQYEINLEQNYNVAVNESTMECMSSSYLSGTSESSVAEIRVMPWIKPEGELISCKDKEIIITEDLNEVC
jgi:hypothetical protein